MMKKKSIKFITLLISILLVLSLVGCGQEKEDNMEKADEVEETELDKDKETDSKEVDSEIEERKENLGGDNMSENQLKAPEVGEEVGIITTNHGEIKVRFFPEVAPKAVENFKTHSKDGYYNGVGFHRIIKDFMIQGGDPDGTGMGGKSIWGAPFEDEFHNDYKNIKGALSMANAGPGTNGSQFFIVHAEETPWLDGAHTVFGQVYEGMDIVDKIANLEVDGNDMPQEPVVMEKVEILEYK